MGDQVTRGSLSTRLCWRLVELVSQLLEPGEREVVRGDLAETGACGSEALGGVLSLVVRRQTALWLDWRPWLAVVGVAAPIGVVLSHTSRWWADGSALDVSLYVQLWDWTSLSNQGWRNELLWIVADTLGDIVALVGWSWASGFALASLSRRTLWITAAIFVAAVFLGTIGTTTVARAGHHDAFAWHFYRVVLPRLVRTVLVLLPAMHGAACALQARPRPRRLTLASAVVLTLLTVWVSPRLEGAMTFGRGVIPADPGPDGFVVSEDDPRPLWPLSLLMLWPAAYVVATSDRNRSGRLAA